MAKSPVVFKLGNNIPNFKFFIAPRRDHNESIKAESNLISNNDSNLLLLTNRTNDSPSKTTTAANNESQPADGNIQLIILHL